MMRNLNNGIYCKIEFLTPTHVGIGLDKKWKAGVDFYIDNGTLQLIDVGKTFIKLNEQQRLKFVSSLSNGELIAGEWRKQFVSRKTSPITCANKDVSEVQSLTRTGQGEVYLPGSSVKGALRSVIFNYLNKRDRSIRDDKKAFGEIDNNLMQWLKIGDFSAIENTEVLRSKIFNLHNPPNWEGGWKHKGGTNGETNSKFRESGFTTDFEVFPEGKAVVGRFLFLDSLISLVLIEKVNNLPAHTLELAKSNQVWEFLFPKVNEYTRNLIRKEMDFFKRYENNETSLIVGSLQKIYDEIVDDGTCVFRMGCGSGFYGMTGDWKFDDHLTTISKPDTVLEFGKSKRVYYKSRKISFRNDKFMPLGFVKLSAITEDEFNATMEKKKQYGIKQQNSVTVEPDIISKPKETSQYIPKYYKGQLKAGAGPIDAIVVTTGKPNKIKLMIEGNEKLYDLIGYSSAIPVDSIVQVKINQLSKTEILQVGFIKRVK